jgi:hypothetical protein
LAVYGFGQKKTPQPFVAACDKFVYTEILGKDGGRSTTEAGSDLAAALTTAVTAAAREDGWAALGVVGSYLTKNDPSFDPRNYGYKKLGDLVRSQGFLAVGERPASDGSPVVHIDVRLKEPA